LARRSLAALRRAGNPDVAAGSRRFFKPSDRVAFFGVKTPELRRLEREAYREVKGRWTLDDALAFADTMMHARQLEAKAFGLLTLSRFHRHFRPAVLGVAERWLRRDLCASWATVDALCPLVITPLVRRHPALIPRVERWTRSRNLWVRRAAAVTFVPSARRGELLDAAYRVAESLLDDKEDLLHKATGWLLREAGRTDRKRLSAFLLRHGPRMSRTAVRYAIEHFPEPQRRRLLRRTS
jgi:3-methyladenine DNA glycosylase AlkD